VTRTSARERGPVRIDEEAVEERFVRSSGPGGQNVNKVATAVQLRFDVGRARAMPVAVRERLARLCGKRMTADGIVVIEARRFRTRERNREDARARLLALLRKAATLARERRETRPGPAAVERRLEEKRRQSRSKERRRRASLADFPGTDR
jgi:ribosome-associated protein